MIPTSFYGGIQREAVVMVTLGNMSYFCCMSVETVAYTLQSSPHPLGHVTAEDINDVKIKHCISSSVQVKSK